MSQESIEYNDIWETDDYWILWKAVETKPLYRLEWLRIFLELGYDSETKKIKMRSIIYPKNEYTFEDVENKAQETIDCPYCKTGVEFFIADSTVADKYVSDQILHRQVICNGEKPMSEQSKLSKRLEGRAGNIGALVLANIVGYVHPWAAVGLGAVAVAIKMSKAKKGQKSSSFLDALILSHLSQIGAALRTPKAQANGQRATLLDTALSGIKTKLGMQRKTAIGDMIYRIFPPKSNENPMLPIRNIIKTSDEAYLWGRRS